jgi:hypothetical protein
MRRPFFSGNYGSALGSTANAANIIAQSGVERGRMFQQLGQQISSSLDKFRANKEKKEKEQRYEQQFVNLYEGNPGNPIFKNLGIQSTDEAKVVAKDISKDPQLIQQAMKFAQFATVQQQAQEASKVRNLQMQQIQQSMKNQQADRLRANQNRMSENQFMQSLMSQTASPQAQRQADIARPGLAALGNGDARNRFMQAQLQQPQNQVPVSSLGSQGFGRFASREGLNPKLSVARMEALRQAEVESQPNLGDSFASKVGSLSPYYFSESDAANAINQQASNLNITLTNDQLDLAMKKQKIVDPLKINELATKQIKQSKMDEAVDILQAGKDLKAFLEDGSPLSANVAKEKLARMIQPQGILTEDDLRRVGGSKGLRDRIDAAIEEMLTGKADAKTMQYLRDTAEIFERSASDKIKFEQPKVVSFLSRSFGITPEDTLKFTTLGKFQEYLPALPSNQSQNTNPQNQGSSPPPFQPTQLPGGGRFTPIR